MTNKNQIEASAVGAALTRRRLVMAGTALPLFGILSRPASAAEFTYKLATGQDPTHPVNKRSQEAIDRIREATGGKLEIRLFPANQLGSDTDLLGQVRNGGVEFFNQASSILATLVPAASLLSVGFAFSSSEQVYAALTARWASTSKRKSRRRACSQPPLAGPTVSARSHPLRSRSARLTTLPASRSVCRQPQS